MSENPFLTAYHGGFRSMLKWEDLERLWQRLDERADAGWYIYAVGEEPPTRPVDAAKLRAFIPEMDALLRRDHDEDYCGIVYVDNAAEPHFIKIYDPNNLGSSCGSAPGGPPPPGWVLSTITPVDLKAAMPQTGSRRRWWQKLFG